MCYSSVWLCPYCQYLRRRHLLLFASICFYEGVFKKLDEPKFWKPFPCSQDPSSILYNIYKQHISIKNSINSISYKTSRTATPWQLDATKNTRPLQNDTVEE